MIYDSLCVGAWISQGTVGTCRRTLTADVRHVCVWNCNWLENIILTSPFKIIVHEEDILFCEPVCNTTISSTGPPSSLLGGSAGSVSTTNGTYDVTNSSQIFIDTKKRSLTWTGVGCQKDVVDCNVALETVAHGGLKTQLKRRRHVVSFVRNSDVSLLRMAEG